MIRPVRFDFNAETAVNNSFQVNASDKSVQDKALKEFETFIATLRQHKIDVTVIDDTPEPHTPDSVFPNNWISFHENGTVLLYPMFAVNRRSERKKHVLDTIKQNVQSEVTTRSMRLRSSSIATDHPLVLAGKKLNKTIYGSPTLSDKALMPFPALKMGPGLSARSHMADEYIFLLYLVRIF